jgi:Protein of unknown function (DUF2934)
LVPDSKLDRENRIRERAYKLWEEHGRPHGRDADIWQQAEDLIGMEENPDAGQVPVDSGARAEESEIQENYGEAPGDQGDRPQTPRARNRKETQD